MTCTIVVGGQYGSEGKGKVVALIAKEYREPWVVRCGGPNSGHGLTIDGRQVILRQIPCGVLNANSLLMISAGCAVDENLLVSEADLLRLPKERVIVDPRAVMVREEDKQAENPGVERIGSTASGTAFALINRMKRGLDTPLVATSEKLKGRFQVMSVAPLLHDHLRKHGNVIVEGTQGFGLSLLHGPHYPFLTSRDTTASAFASEVGLAPREISRVVLVIRTFPIRVGGNSGPLCDELTWEAVRDISGAPKVIEEFTSVTKRLRRVGKFDIDLVKQACRYNGPTALAVMGLDRLDYQNHKIEHLEQISDKAKSFLQMIEKATSVPTSFVGTGFGTWEAVRMVHQPSTTTVQ